MHLGNRAFLEDLVEHLGVLRNFNICADQIASVVDLHLPLIRLVLVSRRSLASFDGRFSLFLLLLHNVEFDLESALHPTLAQEIGFGINLILLNRHVVFLLIKVTVWRVVVFILEVLETLLLVERGEEFAVPYLHLHEIDCEWRKLNQWLDMLP